MLPVTKQSELLQLIGQGTIVRLVSVPITLALSILLARNLGPEQFGVYSFAFSILSVMILVSQFGFPDLTVREVSKLLALNRRRKLGGYLKFSRKFMLSFSGILVTTVFLSLVAFQEVLYENWEAIVAGLPLPVLFAMISHHQAMLRGTGRVILGQLAHQLYRPAFFLTLSGGVLLLGFHLSAFSAMALHSVAAGFVYILVRWTDEKRLSPPDPGLVARERLFAWMKAGIMFSGVAVVRLINQRFDVIAVGILMSATSVGHYSVAAQLSLAAAAMLQMTAGLVTPGISRLSAAGNDIEVERLCRQSAAYSFGASAVVWLIMAVMGHGIVSLTYGSAYGDAVPVILVLVAGQMVNAFFGPIGVLLNMRGKEQITFLVTLFASLVNIALNFLLIPRFGLQGAAMATIIAMTLWNVILWYRALVLWRINSSALPLPRWKD